MAPSPWFTHNFDSPVSQYGEVTAWKVTQENPVYFITNPVGSNKDSATNLGSVCFTIESHDQGVSSGNNFEGDYDGSVTWFEAWIMRGDNQLQDKLDVANGLVVPSEGLDIVAQLGIVPNNKKIRPWYLQTNKRSNEDFFTHKITWSTTDSTEQTLSERNGFEFDRNTGAGFGRKFFESLEKEDRIVVVARAKYAGSVNYVKRVKVEISTGDATESTETDKRAPSDKRSWRDSFRFGKKK